MKKPKWKGYRKNGIAAVLISGVFAGLTVFGVCTGNVQAAVIQTEPENVILPGKKVNEPARDQTENASKEGAASERKAQQSVSELPEIKALPPQKEMASGDGAIRDASGSAADSLKPRQEWSVQKPAQQAVPDTPTGTWDTAADRNGQTNAPAGGTGTANTAADRNGQTNAPACGTGMADSSADRSSPENVPSDSIGMADEHTGSSQEEGTDSGYAVGHSGSAALDHADAVSVNAVSGFLDKAGAADDAVSGNTVPGAVSRNDAFAIVSQNALRTISDGYAGTDPDSSRSQNTGSASEAARQINHQIDPQTDQAGKTVFRQTSNYQQANQETINKQSKTITKNQTQNQEQEETQKQLNNRSEAKGEFRLWIAGLLIIYSTALLSWLLIFRSKGGKNKMKQLWKKVAGCLFAILFASAFMPTQSFAAMQQVQEEKEYVLFALDPLKADEQDLNKALGNAQWEDIGAWLSCMDEEMRDQLLERKTLLTQETSVMEYQMDEQGDLTPKGEERHLLFYEYALLRAQNTDCAKAATFANKSGYYQYQFVKQGQICTFTVKLSGIDTKLGTGTQQNVTISISREGSNFVNFSQKVGNYNSTGGSATCKLQRAFGATEGGYYNLYLNFTFKKPKGYKGSVKYLNNAPTARGDLYFYDNGNYQTNKRTYVDSNSTVDVTESVVACTNIIANTSVGSSNTQGKAMLYQIILTPVSFSTAYNGNGATGGSVATQGNVYDNTYTVAANGFSRQYPVYFNGNGGISAQANATAVYQFAGWGLNQNTVVTHTPGQTYSNYTTIEGTTGTFYAIWKSASVKLPDADRTGYTFKGWATSATATGGLAANTAYTPTAGTTLYATWEANKYTLRFFDGTDETIRGTQSMVYGTAAPLRSLKDLNMTRAGYVFKGWKSGAGTYQNGQSVLNLTAEKNGVIDLTASWEAAKNTRYTVEHYKEQTVGGEDYVLAEMEEKHGTTDTSVTPAVKNYEDYEIPEQQTVTVAGDGSTKVVYKYQRKAPKYAQYRVEHYFQNKNDMSKYDLNTEFSATESVVVGSSMTPNVLTQFTDYEVPNPQTVIVAEDGSTVVKYYYPLKEQIKEQLLLQIKQQVEQVKGQATEQTKELVKEQIRETAGSTQITSYYTTETRVEKESSAKGDINNFKAGDTKYFTDSEGNKYTIYVNPDGTLAIRSMTVNNSHAENLKLAGTLTINNTKYKVTEIAPNAFKNNKKIKNVTIANGITKLGKSAFEGCTNLKSVRFGVGLSDIGARAFYGCICLETVKTTKTITTIGAKAFYNCKKLKSYTIGKYVKRIDAGAFWGCKKLSKMTISESVETIGKQAFYQCSRLKKVNLKTTRLIKIGSSAFKKCDKNLKFVVPAKKKKAYAKLLKGKV